MPDTTIMKVSSAFSPHGKMGQKYLATGVKMSMRLWENESVGQKEESTRDYETIGYVLKGKAELKISGQTVILEPGDSWVVSQHVTHSYNILEPFTAVEATSPSSVVHARDERTNGSA
jgi:quercetin dioxygenase-like cupin family protein